MSGNDTVSLDEQARAILRGNDRGGFTLPTAGLYPYQWNWDSVFAAWGFATFDIDRAWTEIETLISGQWPNGMVPHILFRRDDPDYFPGPDVWGAVGKGPIPSSGISQPPIAATFIRAIWESDKESGDARMRALLPKIKAWHQWFMKWRTTPQGAVYITHPWEAGRDNNPDWDSAMQMIDPVGVGEYKRRDTGHVDASMRPTKADYDRYLWLIFRSRAMDWDEERISVDRPFMVADPSLTFVLLRANRDLSWMLAQIGEDTAEVDRWTERLEQGAEQLRHPDTGIFGAINLRSGEYTGHITSASFLSWYAGIDDPTMRDALKDSLASCQYPIPSLALSSEDYDGMRYWRGPTWAIMNVMIAIGLSDSGYSEQAEFLRLQTRDLIAKHGFAEYFHPETGDPAGGGTFTWTAAVWLAWASPSAGAI